jgi:hypothetical protein
MASPAGTGLDILLLSKNLDAPTVEEPEVAFELMLPGVIVPKQFGTSFAYPCIPLVGVYTDESYDPALPIVTVGVPIADEVRQLPAAVVKLLLRARSIGYVAPGQTELFFIVHSGLQAGKKCCQPWCYNRDEFNLMTHAWTFQDDNIADSHGAVVCKVIM